ncbi:MAG: N-acetylmuramoyl-L-alanine amidase [Spirochaetales bacterium]|jgi:N-acetylmuramoyl-L-alanine amidase|nr:N-acetylmuramoyl-L-alanine amidase [Spirochaetales bacterium]
MRNSKVSMIYSLFAVLSCMGLLGAASKQGELQIQPFFMQPLGTVIIDAGHGGRDPGAAGEVFSEPDNFQLLEKDLNLAVAIAAGRKLQMVRPDLDIVYTREDDSYVSLWGRTHIANSALHQEGKSKLFVSVHVNASESALPKGFEIWTLQETVKKDFFTTYVAEQGIVSMTESLNDELNRELDAAAAAAARNIHASLQNFLSNKTRNRGMKEGRFYVLEHAVMPSVLIETGFLSNKEEAALLNSPEWRDTLSSAIAAGIISYADELSDNAAPLIEESPPENDIEQ